jgi:hypothetical protein
MRPAARRRRPEQPRNVFSLSLEPARAQAA